MRRNNNDCELTKDTADVTLSYHYTAPKLSRAPNEYLYNLNNKEISLMKNQLMSLEEKSNDYYKLQSKYRVASINKAKLNEAIIHCKCEKKRISNRSNEEIDKMHYINNGLKAKLKDQLTEERILEEDKKFLQSNYTDELSDMDALKEKIGEREKIIDFISNDNHISIKQVKELRTSNDHCTQLIKQSHRKIDDEDKSCNNNDNVSNEINAINNIFKEQIDQLQKDNEELNAKIMKGECEIKTRTQDIITNNTKSNEVGNQLKNNKVKLDKLIEEINTKRNELYNIKEHNASLIRDNKVRGNDIEMKNNTIKTSKEHLIQLKENQASINSELDKANEDIMKFKDTINDLHNLNKMFAVELEDCTLNKTSMINELIPNNSIKDKLFQIQSAMSIEHNKLKTSLLINQS